jgi:hypothetical protein
MADFTIDGMSLTITIGKIQTNKKYILPYLVIPVKIKSYSVRGNYGSALEDHPQIGIVFTNMVMKVWMTDKVENGENIVVGYARPDTLQWEIKGEDKNIDFVLMLDHYILSQIEKRRGNENLYLGLDLRAQGYAMEKIGEIHEYELNQERITVAKSDWVEEILPLLNYKNVVLIEVPVLKFEYFKDVIGEVDNAWKKYSMGDYKQVLVHCRNALDGIASKIKQAGFQMGDKEEEYQCPSCGNKWSKSNNNKTDERPVPNWKEFLGDEKIGQRIKEIYRNARGYTAPGAHFGKIIGMDEANFVLFQTYSMVKYILSRFEEKKSVAL